MMDVGKASFTVAFFRDESAAYSVRVCERRSGSRYLYQVGGLSVDSAKELRWSVAGDAVLWTDNAVPWPHNPYEGPAWRPVAGVFATLLGLVMVGAVLFGAMR
jgi:hypothetical protein